MYIDVCKVPDKNKKKADAKHTVVMCSQIFIGSPQRHLATIFAGLQTWTKTSGGDDFLQPLAVVLF